MWEEGWRGLKKVKETKLHLCTDSTINKNAPLKQIILFNSECCFHTMHSILFKKNLRLFKFPSFRRKIFVLYLTICLRFIYNFQKDFFKICVKSVILNQVFASKNHVKAQYLLYFISSISC